MFMTTFYLLFIIYFFLYFECLGEGSVIEEHPSHGLVCLSLLSTHMNPQRGGHAIPRCRGLQSDERWYPRVDSNAGLILLWRFLKT